MSLSRAFLLLAFLLTNGQGIHINCDTLDLCIEMEKTPPKIKDRAQNLMRSMLREKCLQNQVTTACKRLGAHTNEIVVPFLWDYFKHFDIDHICIIVTQFGFNSKQIRTTQLLDLRFV